MVSVVSRMILVFVPNMVLTLEVRNCDKLEFLVNPSRHRPHPFHRTAFTDTGLQWRIHNFIMGGGRSRGGVWGCAPCPEKKLNFYPLKWWVLVHSRITFYVYAKIGQGNGGRQPPPGSATAGLINGFSFSFFP